MQELGAHVLRLKANNLCMQLQKHFRSIANVGTHVEDYVAIREKLSVELISPFVYIGPRMELAQQPSSRQARSHAPTIHWVDGRFFQQIFDALLHGLTYCS